MTASDPTSPDAPLPRRRFFRWLTYGVGAVATAALAVPFIDYLLGGARKAPKDIWQPLGPVSAFPQGQTRLVTFDNPIRLKWDGMVAHTGVYVRYEGHDDTQSHKFLVLAINCAHLGCPVEWFQESGLFMCPCHGGVYYSSGERASGPPPRGLYQCVYRVTNQKGVEMLEIVAPHYPTLQDPLRAPA